MRRARRLLLLLAVPLIALTLGIWLHGRKTRQQQNGTGPQREDALSRRLLREAQALLSDKNGSPQRAGLLAIEALRRSRTREEDAAAREVLSALLRPARVLRSPFTSGRTELSVSGRHVAFWQAGPETAPSAGELSIWEVLTGKELARVKVAWQKRPVQTPVLQFRSDDKILSVSAGTQSFDSEVLSYDVKTGALHQEVPSVPTDIDRSTSEQREAAQLRWLPHTEQIAAWSPDRQRLATLDKSGHARVWDVAAGKPLAAAPLGCSTLQFSRDLRWLFGLSQSTGAVVWSWAGDQHVARASDETLLSQVALIADMQLLVTASEKGVIRVWEMPEHPRSSAHPLDHRVHGVKLAQGGSVAIAHLGGAGAVAWAVASGLSLYEDSAAVYGLAISADGKTLAIRRQDALEVLELMTGRSLLHVSLPALHTDSEGALLGKSIARTIYMPIADAVPRLFDRAEFAEEVPFRSGGADEPEHPPVVKRTVRIRTDNAPEGVWSCYPNYHLFIRFEGAAPKWGCPQYWESCNNGGDWMDKVALSSDGSRVAVTYLDYVFVFDIRTGQRTARTALGHRAMSERGCSKGTGPGLHDFHALPQQLWFQNESEHLLIKEKDDRRRWSWAWQSNAAPVPSVSVDLLGTVAVRAGLIASKVDPSKVRILRLDGSVVSVLPGTESPLMFDTNGRWLATRPDEREDASVHLWDTRTGAAAASIHQESRLDDAVLSGDGKYLLTKGREQQNLEGPIRLYRVADGRVVVQLPPPEEPCEYLALDEHARYVVCATPSFRSRVTIIPLLPPDPLADACTQVLRELTEGEWNQHFMGEPRRPSCD